MKVKDLIEKLKEYDGDLDVVVQYRDSGGDYGGYDEELQFRRTTNFRKSWLKGEKVVREYKNYYGEDYVEVETNRLYL